MGVGVGLVLVLVLASMSWSGQACRVQDRGIGTPSNVGGGVGENNKWQLNGQRPSQIQEQRKESRSQQVRYRILRILGGLCVKSRWEERGKEKREKKKYNTIEVPESPPVARERW